MIGLPVAIFIRKRSLRYVDSRDFCKILTVWENGRD